MAHDTFHQPLPQTLPAICVQQKYIAQISESRKVRDYTSKSDLSPVAIHSKANGILDGTFHNFTRDSAGPIRLRQITMDDVQINSFPVSADNKLALGRSVS